MRRPSVVLLLLIAFVAGAGSDAEKPPSPTMNEIAERYVRLVSYVINYNLGRDLGRAYVEKRGGAANLPTVRWEVFGKLIASPRLPSGLQK